MNRRPGAMPRTVPEVVSQFDRGRTRWRMTTVRTAAAKIPPTPTRTFQRPVSLQPTTSPIWTHSTVGRKRAQASDPRAIDTGDSNHQSRAFDGLMLTSLNPKSSSQRCRIRAGSAYLVFIGALPRTRAPGRVQLGRGRRTTGPPRRGRTWFGTWPAPPRLRLLPRDRLVFHLVIGGEQPEFVRRALAEGSFVAVL